VNGSDPPDLAAARAFAVAAAQDAGALLRDRPREDVRARVKTDDGDIVTDLDLAAEKLITGRIQAEYPGHRIIAEEAGLLGAAAGDGGGPGDCTWLVDPLDGTNNLAIGLPVFVVGIAMCQGDVPVLCVVHDPVQQQTWSAVRDGGAWGPRGRLPQPPCRAAEHGPVLAWTQGHAVARDDPAAQALKLVLNSAARRVLQLWAPLVSWVMLARGDIDGIVGYRAEAVDLPAGALIAAEAGLAVCDLAGRPFDARIGRQAEDRSFVAAHPANVGRLTALVSAAARIEPEAAKLRTATHW